MLLVVNLFCVFSNCQRFRPNYVSFFLFFFFVFFFVFFFFFKQKTAYEIRNCDWSSDVCSSDLGDRVAVLKSHRCVLVKRRIEDVEVRLFASKVVNRDVELTGFVI